jgi:hypothetical protein
MAARAILAMRQLLLAVLAATSLLPSCTQFRVEAKAAYAHLALDGDLGYRNGTGVPAVPQDSEAAYGLGDDQASPYARVEADLGVPLLAVSGFTFADSGSGVLTADFGDIASGSAVTSTFDLTNVKALAALQLRLGPVTLAPGLAASYIDYEHAVRGPGGSPRNVNTADGVLPLAVLRAGVDLGPVAATLEGGYFELDLEDGEAKLLDIEAMFAVHATAHLDVFVGYRHFALQDSGDLNGAAVTADYTVSGFLIGGGVRF